MPTVLYRVQLNTLTKPHSYYCLPVPRAFLSTEEIADLVSGSVPDTASRLVADTLNAFADVCSRELISGSWITITNFISLRPVMPGVLATPKSDWDGDLNIQILVSPEFMRLVRSKAIYERIDEPPVFKPVIASVTDIGTGLHDIARDGYALQLSGSDLRVVGSDAGVWLKSLSSGADAKQDNLLYNVSKKVIVMTGAPAGLTQNSVECSLMLKTRKDISSKIQSAFYAGRVRKMNVIDNGSSSMFLVGSQTGGVVEVIGQTAPVGTVTTLVAQLDGTVVTVSENGLEPKARITQNGSYSVAVAGATVTIEVADINVFRANISYSGRYLRELVHLNYVTMPAGLAFPDTGQIDIVSAGDDAEYGWDAVDNDPSDGLAGFSYVKLDASGNDLPVSAPAWEFTRDNRSGLIYRYNGSVTASWDEAMAAAAAYTGLGRSWRLPTITELVFLANYWKSGGVIDPMVAAISSGFPFSGTEYTGTANVWALALNDGHTDKAISKSSSSRPQFFVTGTQLVPSFTDNGDGTVTDAGTGLMWSKTTIGTVASWAAAISTANNSTLAGHDDWRVANIKEVHTIIDFAGAISTPAIPAPFVIPASSYIWTSTTSFTNTNYAWFILMQNSIGGRGWMSSPMFTKTTPGLTALLVRNT